MREGNSMKITYSECKEISREQLQNLFKSIDWKSGDFPDELQEAMKNSHSVVSAWYQGELIGLVNALSDGVMTVYFHYMLVHPNYQNKGIGKNILEMILKRYEGYKNKLECYDKSAVEKPPHLK
jgi:GNAT superfamily N-acetyltransferase